MSFRIVERRTSSKTYYKIQELVTKQHWFKPPTQEWEDYQTVSWDEWYTWTTTDFNEACEEKQKLEEEKQHMYEYEKATWVVTTKECQ